MHPLFKIVLCLFLSLSGMGCILAPPQGVDVEGELYIDREAWTLEVPPAAPEILVKKAEKSLEAKEYQLAVKYGYYASQYAPRSAEKVEGKFLIAEAMFENGQYGDAYRQYLRLLNDHPDYRKVRRVLERIYEIGSAWIFGRRKTWGLIFNVSAVDDGIKVLNQLIREYPYLRSSADDLIADDAAFRVAEAHFKEWSYKKAIIAYQRVVKSYPKSEWADISAFKIGLSYLRQSEGVEYDQTPLEYAKIKLREYLQRFPDGNKVAEAKTLIENIETSQAQHMFEVGEYYESWGYPVAAVLYYRSVITKYPRTKLVAKAQKKLAKPWAKQAAAKWKKKGK